jgi:putative ABC transport system permease protein
MISRVPVQPPQWPVKLLRFFLREKYVEEIEGDLEEIFYENAARHSVRKAKLLYTWDVIKLFRPNLVRQLKFIERFNHLGMLQNYFKVSIRGLLKNPLNSTINIFGLAVAIGISLVVYAFMKFDYSTDQFHANVNNVYLVTCLGEVDGTQQQYGKTPRPLGELMATDFAQIEKMCRVEDGRVIIKYQDQVFHEQLRYVDPEFLEIFTFPMKWGTAQSLVDLNSIVLSEDMAKKYFGDENPIGQDMLVKFDESQSKPFKVTGVAQAFPKSRSIDFKFLVNYGNLRVRNPQRNESDWSEFVHATLIQVTDTASLNQVRGSMAQYQRLQNEARHPWPITAFVFEPLRTLHMRSGDIREDISYDDNREGRIGMPIIALFMLALACLNYINIALVSATRRLKEIGVRKVIGANRIRVIVQFLSENIIVTCFALLVGIALCYWIFLPWFVQFTDWPLELNLIDSSLWIFLAMLLVITGIVSGIYPAFYISKFQAVNIFKGSVQFGRKNPMTKIFLGAQLVLACITITAAVVFTQNNTYQSNLGWGYDQQGILYAPVSDQAAFEKLKAALQQEKDVESITGSTHHIGKNIATKILKMPSQKEFEVDHLAVDANYFNTLGLTLKEGRLFRTDSENDKRTIVVNELFAQNLKLENPIGALFELDSTRYEVVGVLKDFHSESFFHPKKPTMFTLADETDYRFLSLRIANGEAFAAHEKLKAHWAKLFPETPFQGGYQEDLWTQYYFSLDRSETFNKVLAIIAVMLACLGLYGLVTLNVSGRVREFSIRKTMGAGIQNISGLILKEYAWVIVIALAIGAPISYVFTDAYLNMLFTYHMPVGVLGVTLSLMLLALVLLVVISSQVNRVHRTNPVEGLKAE